MSPAKPLSFGGAVARVALAGALSICALGCRRGSDLAGSYYGSWTDASGRTGVVALEVSPDGKLRANLDSERLRDVVLVSGSVDGEGATLARCRFSRGTRSLDFPGGLAATADGEGLKGRFTLKSGAPLDFGMDLRKATAYREFPSHPLVADAPEASAPAPQAPAAPAREARWAAVFTCERCGRSQHVFWRPALGGSWESFQWVATAHVVSPYSGTQECPSSHTGRSCSLAVTFVGEGDVPAGSVERDDVSYVSP